MQKVSGQKDPIIRLLRELTGEEGRRERELFFAEGEELANRAFDYGGDVHSVVMLDKYAATPRAEPLIARAAERGVECFVATEGLIAKMLDAKPTPECLVIVERRVISLEETTTKGSFVMMVESCENADNLGMLLRSTDAAGVESVVLAAETTDAFHRRVVRGSRGAVFTVPLCVYRDSRKVMDGAKSGRMQVIGTSANTDTIYTEVDYRKPTMLIVGNEHTGISDAVREMADAVVRIPMRGKINSLNIAVAASMMMYEVVRQRSE